MSAGGATPAPPAAAPVARRGGFISDFTIRRGRVVLRKTGNSAAIDRRLIAEVAIWLAYHLAVRARGMFVRLTKSGRPAIWFAPEVPHPRYMVRAAMIWAGVRIARSPAEADAAFFFEDATRCQPPLPQHPRAFNFACTDISKSRVATIFAEVFGYPLALDPQTWRGEAVEKSEENGTHDGRIVACPRAPQPGKVYQRLIDTIGEDGCARDLRTHCIGDTVVAVWDKRRAAAGRFLPPNLSARRHWPEEVFSAAELRRISAFAAAMGADWCGLDILRDRDGRIYVVDVNKTDAGPIIALPFREKLASTALLADALLALLARDRPGCGH